MKNGPPGSFSVLDDTQSRTILDTPSRVLKLGFSVNLTSGLLGQLLEINLVKPRRISNPDHSRRPRTGITCAHNRSYPALTRGVFPIAPVKPSTVPEVNDLQSCRRRACEFRVAMVRTDANIVDVQVKNRWWARWR